MSSHLRILVCHNDYQGIFPSGENDLVRQEIQSLRLAGHDVETFIRSSDELIEINTKRKMELTRQLMSNSRIDYDLLQKVTKFSPNVIHFHNIFPLIGNSIFKIAESHNIPLVNTVHNYRSRCINGKNYRNNRVCLSCNETRRFPGVINRCYQDSFSKSFMANSFYNRYRSNMIKVSHFFVLTEYMREMFLDFGIPNERISIRPTSTTEPTNFQKTGSKNLLFAGRLTQEKGIRLLLEAWNKSVLRENGWTLSIAGSGPENSFVSERASEDFRIKFLGNLSQSQLEENFKKAEALCVPSLWFEGFPRVISQAASMATPILMSDIGSLATIGDPSWIIRVEPDVNSWVQELNNLEKRQLRVMGKIARQWWETEGDINLSVIQLERVYREVSRRK